VERKDAGFWLSQRELQVLNVPAEIGARFETDQLELFPALFEVVSVDDDGSVTVRKVRYSSRPPKR
jgi:hypothetical protein